MKSAGAYWEHRILLSRSSEQDARESGDIASFSKKGPCLKEEEGSD